MRRTVGVFSVEVNKIDIELIIGIADEIKPLTDDEVKLITDDAVE